MSEISQTEDLSDFEILKSTIPAWYNSVLEPFLTSPQQDVESARWNKIQWDMSNGQGNTGNQNQSTFTAIVNDNGIPRYANIVGSLDGVVT